jgi:5-formyltetrahydrofolate cyclo-ligase
MTGTGEVLRQKKALRERIKSWRALLDAEAATRAAQAVADHGLGFLGSLADDVVISGFSPLPDEFRAWPLLRRLSGEGRTLAMPVMVGRGQPLIFRAWAPGDAMDRAVWGIAEPKVDKAELEPDVVIAPLLAFDTTGWRLGYGGGFYDRTLKKLRSHKEIIVVGLAFDEQQVDAVPHLDYDQRLDWVLRPSGPLRCAG